MPDEEVLYVDIDVEIKNREWQGTKKGRARLNFTIPRFVLPSVDMQGIIKACVDSALIQYDNPDKEE